MKPPENEDMINKRDGGAAQRVDIGGSSFTSGGFGSYTQLIQKFGDGTATPEEEKQWLALQEKTKNFQPDGGSGQSRSFGGGYPGIGSGSYSSSSGGGSICCIGIIILIILGLILNFIFHIELWLIAVILIIVFIVGVIALVILD